MATRRQQNWLGQQRVDVSDLRSVESGVTADFDILAGKMMAGRQPLVIRGFTISTTNAAGNPAEQLQLSVASGLLMHFGASESGTIFMVEDGAATEELSATNSKVRGGFIANSVNYVGLDLVRAEDIGTSDLKQFLDADTKQEIPKTVPVARTLNYEIVISTQPFSITSNVCPIAKVETNTNNNVVAITDSRNMLFRLGSGGDTPDSLNVFTWADSTRRENNQYFEPPTSAADPFAGGDKEIVSLKEWMDSIMTRLWEVGSGEYWYRPTTRDGIKLVCGQPVISATQDNFEWVANTLTWKSLHLVFENSTVYFNTIADGSAVLTSDGQCLYVDLQRASSSSSLVPVVGTLTSLGSPALPGSRFILAWRMGGQIHVRDRGFEVGRAYVVATTTVLGVVKLSRAATTPLAPIVLADSERNAVNGVAGLDASQSVLGTGLSRSTTFAAGTLSVGTGTNDNAVNIAKSSTTTTINGAVLIKDTLTTAAANTMSVGATTQTGLTLGRSGASTALVGSAITGNTDIAIPATNNFKFQSAKTRHMIFGVTDLKLTNSSTRFPLLYSGVYSWPSDAAVATNLRGRVYLPIGASLTGAQIFASNANAFSVNSTIWMYGNAYNSGGAWTQTVIKSGTLPDTLLGGGAPQWTTLSLIGAPFVVTDDTFVEVVFDLAAVDLVYIHGFRFTYTMTNLDATG